MVTIIDTNYIISYGQHNCNLTIYISINKLYVHNMVYIIVHVSLRIYSTAVDIHSNICTYGQHNAYIYIDVHSYTFKYPR